MDFFLNLHIVFEKHRKIRLSWDHLSTSCMFGYTNLMGQRSRVRIRPLPQWSWSTAGSLWNNVENLRVERETCPWPWGKKRSLEKIYKKLTPRFNVKLTVKSTFFLQMFSLNWISDQLQLQYQESFLLDYSNIRLTVSVNMGWLSMLRSVCWSV